MEYLVFLDSQADGWRLSRERLIRELLSDWPGAALVPEEEMNQTEMRDIGWVCREDGQTVEAWSARSGLGLSLDGDDELAMKVAAWFRGLIPDEIPVHFCDDMYTFSIDVPPGASAVDIARWCEEVA